MPSIILKGIAFGSLFLFIACDAAFLKRDATVTSRTEDANSEGGGGSSQSGGGAPKTEEGAPKTGGEGTEVGGATSYVPRPVVRQVAFGSNSMQIAGESLDSVKQLAIQGNGGTVEFSITGKTRTQIQAQPLGGARFLVGALYNLIVTSASAEQVPITFVLGNGSVTPAMLDRGYLSINGGGLLGSLSLPGNGLRVGSNQLVVIDDRVGIGTETPKATLDVAGEIKFGNTSSACDATKEGQQRYNASDKVMEFCNGTAWTRPGVATLASGSSSTLESIHTFTVTLSAAGSMVFTSHCGGTHQMLAHVSLHVDGVVCSHARSLNPCGTGGACGTFVSATCVMDLAPGAHTLTSTGDQQCNLHRISGYAVYSR